MSDTTRLDEIRQREAAATEGPWQQNGSNGVHTPRGICVAITQMDSREQRKADAEFLAAARVDVPWLVAEVERLRGENERLQFDLRVARGAHDGSLIKLTEAVAERDAALAAVTAIREFIDEVDELYPDARWTPSMWTWKIRAALGTVGQPKDECEHCEPSGRCVGSCLDDPREDPNGE